VNSPYTLQSFGGAPQQPPGPPQGPPFGPPQGQPPRPQPPYGMPPPQNPFGPPPYGLPRQDVAQQRQPDYSDTLAVTIAQVLQTIEQVRAKLHQAESIRGLPRQDAGIGYGQQYPQQAAYVDVDTVDLLDKLYDQLGHLSRELAMQRGRY